MDSELSRQGGSELTGTISFGSAKSLRTRFITLFVLFALVPALLIGAVGTYMNIGAIHSTNAANNLTIARNISGEVSRLVTYSQGLTEASAASPAMVSMNPAVIRDTMMAIQQKNPQFELLYVMDTTGMQIARTSGTPANRADRPYFKAAIAGRTFFSDVYVSSSTNAPCLTISTPIRDKSGAIVGVFAADISLKSLADIAGEVRIGRSGYVDIVDSQGVLIANPDKDRVLQKENVSNLNYVGKVLKGEEGNTTEVSTGGEQSLVVYTPVKDRNWGVIAYLPQSEIHGAVLHSVGIMAVLVLLSLLLAAATAFYVARGIARPLGGLADGAARMADGDLTCDVHAGGALEIDQLSQALNNMQQGFLAISRSIVSSSEQVAASAQQLTASAEQSAQAANQVAGSITAVAGGSEKQLAAVNKTVAEVEKISAGIRQVASKTDVMSEAAAKTALAANDGEKSVETAVRQMGNIEESVSYSAEVVAKLGRRSQEIGQIVDTIAGIAGQTNLLALNAAVEAARAGELGRGFAVVAEEVRKLAEQSQEAARQIAELIGEVQADTAGAITAMDRGTQEVAKGTEVVGTAGKAFGDVVEQMNRISGQVREVAAEIQQMAAGSQQIVEAVREIDGISKATAGQTQTVSAATEEQSASMEEIAASSQSLAKLADELQKAAGRFKIK